MFGLFKRAPRKSRCPHDHVQALTVMPWVGSDWTVKVLCLDCAVVFDLKLNGTRGMSDQKALFTVVEQLLKVRGYVPRNSGSAYYDQGGQ